MFERSYDVVVVGGGPSGFAAAVASARAGAKTALVERYGFCGGSAVAAGVSVYINQPAGDRNLGGAVYTEMAEALVRAGGAYGVDARRSWLAVNVEDLKVLCDQWLVAAGVDLYYHVLLARVARSGPAITTVVGLGKSGQEYALSGRMFVDATGDADLARLAGVPTQTGRPEDGQCQPMTTIFRVGPVNVAQAGQAGAELIDGKYLWWGSGHASLHKLTQQAREKGDWPIPKDCFALMWSDPRCPEMVTVNGTRISGFDGADSVELGRAEVQGRLQAQGAVRFMRHYLPGFGQAALLGTGPQIGVRETRRIAGLYTLTHDDVLKARSFDDQIAEGAYEIDVHTPNSDGATFEAIPPGCAYGIPYRCLLPCEVRNLLVPGRALSATHLAAGSLRVMPICMTTGEAAGRAAALACHHGNDAHRIPVGDLQVSMRHN